jgi:hypothetical protein
MIGLASEWVGKMGKFVHTIVVSATQEEAGTQMITAAPSGGERNLLRLRGCVPLPPLQPIPRKRVEHNCARF